MVPLIAPRSNGQHRAGAGVDWLNALLAFLSAPENADVMKAAENLGKLLMPISAFVALSGAAARFFKRGSRLGRAIFGTGAAVLCTACVVWLVSASVGHKRMKSAATPTPPSIAPTAATTPAKGGSRPSSSVAQAPVASNWRAIPQPAPLEVVRRISTVRPTSRLTSAEIEGELLALRLPGARPSEPFRECASCPVMIAIPSGSVVIGSSISERSDSENELPQTQVTVAQPFAAGKYEVTFDEWDACILDRACRHRPADNQWGRGRMPVINVSWTDTREFVRWLRAKTGAPYRLLSEVEWEYAARGSVDRSLPYATGRTIGPHQANFATSIWEELTNGRPRPVGSYPPNSFGLHDMHGNVWEWVEDCFHESYDAMPVHVRQTGSAWHGVCGSDRIVRGGSWGSEAWHLRSARRLNTAIDTRDKRRGFRVARTLAP